MTTTQETIQRQKLLLIEEMRERLRELGFSEVLQVKNYIGELLLKQEKRHKMTQKCTF